MQRPLAYARRILINLALDGSKRRSRNRAELARPSRPDGPLFLRGESQSSWGAFAAVDDRLELLRALAVLPPRQRAALVLRYVDDLSESEVALTLGVPIGTVKSTTSRALEKMRELIRIQARQPEPALDVLACSVRKGER